MILTLARLSPLRMFRIFCRLINISAPLRQLSGGTITALHLPSKIAIEVTTLRTDSRDDGRHAIVRYGADWREDAAAGFYL